MASRIGQVAYRLELPSYTSIHPVFHVSQLRKAIGTSNIATNIPFQLSSEMELMVEFEEGDMVYVKLKPYRHKSLAKRIMKN